MKDQIKKAVELRKKGFLEESNALLLVLVKSNPNDAMVNYQCAWSFDVLERETEAIPYYEKAIALGLPKDDLKEAYLGLGSTYRTIGQYEQSKAVFENALAQFDDNGLKVFYAMTLYNLKLHEEAMAILLKLLADTSNDSHIQSYAKAIHYYAPQLDRKFVTEGGIIDEDIDI